MKGLLLKDFYSVRTEYKMYGIALPFVVVLMLTMSWDSDGQASPGSFGFLMTYGAVAALGLSLNTFTYDEKSGFTRYALATTVSRKMYLAEKYVFHLINSTIGSFIGMIGMLILSVIKEHTMIPEDVFGAVLVAGGYFLGTAVVGIWQISLSVRFDSLKARFIFVVLILISAVSAVAAILIEIFSESIPIQPILIAVAVGLTIWMFCMSFVWMKKKEF